MLFRTIRIPFKTIGKDEKSGRPQTDENTKAFSFRIIIGSFVQPPNDD